MLSAINSWPHELQLSGTEETRLVCEQPLRNLPGKRLVCRGTWNERSVLVKLFLHHKRAQRHWLREKDGVELLTANNLTTPGLLFAGALNDSTPVLIFDYLPMATTALEQWQQCLDDHQRITLLKELISTIAAQHQCGLWQKDIHLGNFLISAKKIYTIDGDGIRNAAHLSKATARKKQRANLALFLAQLPPQHDHLLPQILEHYRTQSCQTAGDNSNSTAEQESILHHELPNARRRRRHDYVSKAYRNCGEFVRQNSFKRLCIYRRDIDPQLLNALGDNPDALFTGATLLKEGNSATVASITLNGHNWVIKRYNIKNFIHGLKRCWRPTRAWVSWGNAHRLTISGINTPQAVAMIEKRWGPLRLGGYYICAQIAAPAADQYLLDPHQETIADKDRVKERFVTLFQILYQLRTTHGDCKASNFLIHHGRIYVIDLDAMQEYLWQPLFVRAFTGDRARFLRNWDADPELQRWFTQHLIQPKHSNQQ